MGEKDKRDTQRERERVKRKGTTVMDGDERDDKAGGRIKLFIGSYHSYSICFFFVFFYLFVFLFSLFIIGLV